MAIASEESPLLPPQSDTESANGPTTPPVTKRSDLLLIYGTFLGISSYLGCGLRVYEASLTILGVFLASADEALVISTYSAIASQFHRLSQGPWLLLAYNFGYCISLPVVSNGNT